MTVSITPSTVQMLACHFKFATLAGRYPRSKDRSPVLRFGIALHDVLRRGYDRSTPGMLPHKNNLPLHVRAAFTEQAYKDEAEREEDMNRAHRIASSYMDADEVAEFTTGVECAGRYPVESNGEVVYVVSARLDRIIEMPDGTCIALDYTTGRKPLSVEQVWCNLAVLRLLRPGRKDYVLMVDRLSDADPVERKVYPSRHLRGVVKLVTARVLAFQRAPEHLPTPGDQCLFCPHTQTCNVPPPRVSADALDWD